MTCSLDTAADPDGILAVWGWEEDAYWLEHAVRANARIECSTPDVGSLRRRLAMRQPRWLLMGPGVDEDAVLGLVTTAWHTYPELRLAMLGPVSDLRRCERWLRRGCHAYLPDTIAFPSLLTALDCAAAADAVLVDRAFYPQGMRARQGGSAPSLTPRQHEVLSLLDRQLTNPEIASALHVSENTIEFHVRRVLDKLGARNRMQAVRRAYDLGLI